MRVYELHTGMHDICHIQAVETDFHKSVSGRDTEVFAHLSRYIVNE